MFLLKYFEACFSCLRHNLKLVLLLLNMPSYWVAKCMVSAFGFVFDLCISCSALDTVLVRWKLEFGMLYDRMKSL